MIMVKSFCRAVLVTLAILAHTPAAHAADSTGAHEKQIDRLRRGLDAFESAVATGKNDSPEAQALYAESLEAFESVIADGVENGHLYYNAGNAALRKHQVGRAIAYYRMAQRLIPGEDDVARNLAFARRQSAVRIAPDAGNATKRGLLFWYHGASTHTRWLVGIAAYVLLWSLIASTLRSGRLTASLRWAVAAAVVVVLTFGGSVAYDEYRRGAQQNGVVIRDETVLRKGNGTAYEPQIEQALSDGVEFAILESRDTSRGDRWYRIRLNDGTDGWVSSERVLVF
jgi:tetratricopeptide (TPR) repeat protein